MTIEAESFNFLKNGLHITGIDVRPFGRGYAMPHYDKRVVLVMKVSPNGIFRDRMEPIHLFDESVARTDIFMTRPTVGTYKHYAHVGFTWTTQRLATWNRTRAETRAVKPSQALNGNQDIFLRLFNQSLSASMRLRPSTWILEPALPLTHLSPPQV